MKEKQLFTITDLGGGDGGKGGVVHKICDLKKAHTVIKIGGAQGSHGVRTEAGQNFNFGQFGCGTFSGTKTHISNLMVMEPYRLLQEADKLKYEWGIHNIFNYLTIDENALCSTPYHNLASQLRELDRKDRPKGTVGTGVGEAFYDAELHPHLAIRAKDLLSADLHKKIKAIRDQKIEDLKPVLSRVNTFLPEDSACAQDNIEILHDISLVDRIVEKFNALGKLATIVDDTYLAKNILSQSGTVVVESSHGILTDRYYGFHPHTTKLRTIPQGIVSLLNNCGYDGKIFKIGVTRGYQIRHGAGPMVTENAQLLNELLPGSSKEENRWQGKVRVGALDLVALRYALEVCGGSQFFDGLAVTWFDQIQSTGQWHICDTYMHADNANFFSSPSAIKVRHGVDFEQLQYQEKLTEALRQCRPEVYSYDVKNKNQEELIQLCSETLQSKLNVPVVMMSFGPTEKNKICL